MTRKRHIENVNPREEYIKLLNSNRSPDKILYIQIQKKSSYRNLGNNQIEELLPGVFNKNTELTYLEVTFIGPYSIPSILIYCN